MNPSFDLISDLYLTQDDHFDWEGKPTSLYCIVAGNVSDDLNVVRQTLIHLSTHYHGVFYIDGSLEHQDLKEQVNVVNHLIKIIEQIPNVVYLHNNVVVVDGVALIAANGWYANRDRPEDIADMTRLEIYRMEDTAYLTKTMNTLQIHPDVKDVIMITNSLPSEKLMFGSHLYAKIPDDDGPARCLLVDSEHKINNWVYGSYPLSSTATIDGINYYSNPKYTTEPYWPKRISITPRSRL
jgi:hypothetical protein